MARITAKQAKEMNEAYAKVYQNLAEETARERMQRNKERITNPFGNVTIEKEDGTKLKQGDKGFDQALDKGRDTVTKYNKDSLEGRTGNSNKSNNQTTEKPVTQSKQSTPTKDTSQGQLDAKSTHNTGGVPQAAANIDKIASSGPGSGSVKVDGKALMNKLKADSGDRVQSSGNTPSPKQPTQEPGVKTSRTVVKDGNKTTTTTRRSADSSTPEGAAAVNKEKSAFADRMAARRAARDGNAGSGNTGGGGQSTGGQASQTRPATGRGQGNRPVAGNQNRQGGNPGVNPAAAIKGGLSRLGSLAGKAVGAARSAAGNVAGGIKQGAQAVAGALANKGPIQGRASGPQRRAQQAQTRAAGAAGGAAAGAAAAKPVAIRPVQGQQPAAKPVVTQQPVKKMGAIEKSNRAIHGNAKIDALKSKNAEFQAAKKSGNLAQYRKANPKMSGADRAKAMAKARIAAKNAPAPKAPAPTAPINSSYDFFDDTVQFLVSEGHAKDVSEAMSIMSESEFIDAFNQELNG